MSEDFESKETQRVWRTNIDSRLAACLRATNDREINFTNADSATAIQAKIDALHKYIPYGETVIFQFADGVYNLNNSLTWGGFYGGGVLNVYGNSTNNSLSTTKAVHLNFNNSTDGLVFENNSVQTNVYYLKITASTKTGGISCIEVNSCAKHVHIRYGYILGDGTNAGQGVFAVTNAGSLRVMDTYFTNMQYAIHNNSSNSIVSFNNDDTGTQPAYGLFANEGNIHASGTQPAGSTANELVSNAEIY